MKKLLVMVLVATLCSASMALAETTLTNTPGSTPDSAVIGSTPFQVSTNVTLIAAGNAGGYNCTSKHLSGDKNFLSSSVSASIEESAGVKGEALAELLVSSIEDNVYTGAGGY